MPFLLGRRCWGQCLTRGEGRGHSQDDAPLAVVSTVAVYSVVHFIYLLSSAAQEGITPITKMTGDWRKIAVKHVLYMKCLHKHRKINKILYSALCKMPGSPFYCILKDAVVNISQGCSLSCIAVYTRCDKYVFILYYSSLFV